MTTKHTPTPWESEFDGLGEDHIIHANLGKDTSGMKNIRTIGRIYHRYTGRQEMLANASFIVRACNSFDLNLKALSDILASKSLEEAKEYANKAMRALRD